MMGLLKVALSTAALSTCFPRLVNGIIYFAETFDDDSWQDRWTRIPIIERPFKKRRISQKWEQALYDGTLGDDKSWETYWAKEKANLLSETGNFKLSTGRWFHDAKENQGLMTVDNTRHYLLIAPFPQFINENSDVVFQFQVKDEWDVKCGGAYLKLLARVKNISRYTHHTPYNIMFGPDKCGYKKRTHLVFGHNNGTHRDHYLKKFDMPYHSEPAGTSHVYRLVLRPDSTIRVDVDGEEIYEGSMKDDWDMLLPRTIDDPEDYKPEDWVDESMMDDPDEMKPVDWNDDRYVSNPEQEEPEDWIEEDDGMWEAEHIDNPEYSGVWVAKQIPNPEYFGYWEPAQVPNPHFQDDDKLYLYKFASIGIDVWQVKAGVIFDNIILTDDEKEADRFLERWKPLTEVEYKGRAAEDEDILKRTMDTEADNDLEEERALAEEIEKEEEEEEENKEQEREETIGVEL